MSLQQLWMHLCNGIVMPYLEFSDFTRLVSNQGLTKFDIGRGVVFTDAAWRNLCVAQDHRNRCMKPRTPNDASRSTSHHDAVTRMHPSTAVVEINSGESSLGRIFERIWLCGSLINQHPPAPLAELVEIRSNSIELSSTIKRWAGSSPTSVNPLKSSRLNVSCFHSCLYVLWPY